MSITVSPSTVAWLMGCHLRFSFQTQNRQGTSNLYSQPSIRLGNAIHDCLARLYSQPQGPYHLVDLPQQLRSAFGRQQYQDEGTRGSDIARADRLIRSYLCQMDDDPCTILGVERSANFPVKVDGEVAYRIAARHDLLLVRDAEPGILIVRDWKVSRSTRSLTVEQQWIALAAARWAFPQYRTLRLEIDTLRDEVGCDRVTYKAEALKGIVQRVNERVMEYLAADEHQPTPGHECEWCPLRPECESKSGLDWTTLDF